MAGSLNRVMLIGHLGRDPETRSTKSGTPVTNFTLATNDRFKDASGTWQDRTEWHRIVAFGAKAETIAKYLSKGRQIFLEGALQTRDWEDKDGHKRSTTEIVLRDFQFLGDRGSNAGGSAGGGSYRDQEASAPAKPATETTTEIDDEDIPF